jgi:O-antigen/teichoic acid export membrane protein
MADRVATGKSGERDVFIYLVCRAVSAIVNVVAVALFTRQATPELYGQYLIGFSLCFIVYGLTVQWAVYAHFGTYSSETADRFAASLLVISGLAMGPALLVIAALEYNGVFLPDIAWGSAALLVCFTIYFAATEISRARLMPGLVVIATVARSVLSLVFGSISLMAFDTPAALLAAVGLGYVLGAMPVYFHFSRTIWGNGFVWPHRSDVVAMLRYGWPLAIAFGASAGALNIDRILLERYANAATVAPYGAVLDLMKQTFIVLAEAISSGYIAHARMHLLNGEKAEADYVLRRDFISQTYIVVFGTVSFILLGRLVFSVVLAPSYLPLALSVLPILLLGNGVMVMRSHYFGQSIYLGASSMVELVGAVVMALAATAAGILLVPRFGAHGAAMAFVIGQIASLILYVAATQKTTPMPIEWGRGGALIATGLLIVLIGWQVEDAFSYMPAMTLNFCIIAFASLFFAIRWNVFNFAVVARRILGVVRKVN